MAHRDTLIAWLNDAYAMENNLIQTLENHASDAKGHPMMQAKIEEHLQATRHHAELVKGCVERLGSSTSAIKTGLSNLMATVQGIGTSAASDELVKNALSDYAAEHFEIACYTSLFTAAQALGETEVAQICQQILRDEQDMASWLQQQIPMVTQEFVSLQAREHGAA
jgi:ferritin-like metal-binding protein YciE